MDIQRDGNMTKEQCTDLMNILAVLISYVNKFALSFRLIHGLIGFEFMEECVRKEMRTLFDKDSIDIFLKGLQSKLKSVTSKENQKNMLTAYHMCMWLDHMLSYEEMAIGKLSIYALIPLRAFSYVEIDALNDNYEDTGICINPKLPIFKTAMLLDDGTEKERTAASRDAFAGMNGELCNIGYFEWNKKCIVHNIIVPYEYSDADGVSNVEGNLKVGFIPVSDKTDIIVPSYKDVRNGKYKLREMHIDAPNHGKIIYARLEQGLELACENQVDVVFAPEMLGTGQTEKCVGNYNEFVHRIYSNATMNGKKPPLITVMPSYWKKGINSAALVYRDGRVLGWQKKYTPYVDFQSCSIEGIKQEQAQELYLIHIYGVHRIVISICAEFLGDFDDNFICGQLGATLVIVPSFSHGERDFVSKLGTLFPYGTSIVWGDCCGAVAYAPKIIGGCSLVGSNDIYKMGNNCKCAFSCGYSKGCLFTVDLPLKVLYSKKTLRPYQPVLHVLT